MIIAGKLRVNILSLSAAGMLLLFTAASITSCKKDGNASPTGLNTQINILNLSPDVLYLELWTNQVKNGKLYRYPTPGGYTFVNALDNQLQMRRQHLLTTVYDDVPLLKSNTRYSLFIYGLQTNNTWQHLFVADTASMPAIGRGKVRFINALSRAATVDVTANNTIAFKGTAMGKVSDWVEMPAGIYSFKVLSTGTSSVVTEVREFTIQDGRLYTLYTHGIIGRTDSAQVAAAVITNR